ncbi:MAG: hypothetical protein ABEH35_06315 [Haloarculaceae archaeon]
MSDDDDDDPFERLGPPEDRDGDPFEDLDAPGNGPPDGDERDREESDESDIDFGVFEPAPAGEGRDVPDDEPPAGSGDDPFDGLDDSFAGEVREGTPFDEGRNVFERVEVGEIDEDDIWDSLVEGSEELEDVSTDRGYDDVSKHRYCEQCEFFSAPPEVACSHEGTEIVEFVDMETVRVRNCPIVEQRRELERME